jgi:hypothetical protein
MSASELLPNQLVGHRNQWAYNPSDGSTEEIHPSHLREASNQRNVEHGLVQAPHHHPRPALRTSNRDRGAKSLHGSERARASRIWSASVERILSKISK